MYSFINILIIFYTSSTSHSFFFIFHFTFISILDLSSTYQLILNNIFILLSSVAKMKHLKMDIH